MQCAFARLDQDRKPFTGRGQNRPPPPSSVLIAGPAPGLASSFQKKPTNLDKQAVMYVVLKVCGRELPRIVPDLVLGERHQRH